MSIFLPQKDRRPPTLFGPDIKSKKSREGGLDIHVQDEQHVSSPYFEGHQRRQGATVQKFPDVLIQILPTILCLMIGTVLNNTDE